MNLVFLGAPGVGKGTQGKLISSDFGIPQISTGDMLRAAMRDGTKLGLQAKSYVKKGELVPDDVIIDMVKERLVVEDCEKGFLLDGFPRSLPQAEALTGLLEEVSRPLDKVINIEVGEEEIINRLASRRICRKSGHDYNIISNPPPENMICPVCGGEIYQRDDDKEETIRNRLGVYLRETAPLVEYYSNRGLLQSVNGESNSSLVHENIKRILESIVV